MAQQVENNGTLLGIPAQESPFTSKTSGKTTSGGQVVDVSVSKGRALGNSKAHPANTERASYISLLGDGSRPGSNTCLWEKAELDSINQELVDHVGKQEQGSGNAISRNDEVLDTKSDSKQVNPQARRRSSVSGGQKPSSGDQNAAKPASSSLAGRAGIPKKSRDGIPKKSQDGTPKKTGKNPEDSAPPEKGIPGWVWTVGGLVLGGAVFGGCVLLGTTLCPGIGTAIGAIVGSKLTTILLGSGIIGGVTWGLTSGIGYGVSSSRYKKRVEQWRNKNGYTFRDESPKFVHDRIEKAHAGLPNSLSFVGQELYRCAVSDAIDRADDARKTLNLEGLPIELVKEDVDFTCQAAKLAYQGIFKDKPDANDHEEQAQEVDHEEQAQEVDHEKQAKEVNHEKQAKEVNHEKQAKEAAKKLLEGLGGNSWSNSEIEEALGRLVHHSQIVLYNEMGSSKLSELNAKIDDILSGAINDSSPPQCRAEDMERRLRVGEKLGVLYQATTLLAQAAKTPKHRGPFDITVHGYRHALRKAIKLVSPDIGKKYLDTLERDTPGIRNALNSQHVPQSYGQREGMQESLDNRSHRRGIKFKERLVAAEVDRLLPQLAGLTSVQTALQWRDHTVRGERSWHSRDRFPERRRDLAR